MSISGDPRPGRTSRDRVRRLRSDRIEAALVVALAGLVLIKGAPALAGIASGMAEMMMAVAPF